MKGALVCVALITIFGCVPALLAGRVSTATYDLPESNSSFCIYVDEGQLMLTEKKLQGCISEKMCALGFKQEDNVQQADYVILYSYNIGEGHISVQSQPDFVWGGQKVSSSTKYPRFFQIILIDRAATVEANKPIVVWQGEVRSSGSSSNIGWLGEYFINQIFKNYGKSVDNKTFMIPVTAPIY